jgi:predicted CopG family antitoxin
MFEPKIAIDRELYERVKKVAERAGYSSVNEFVLHLLEKAAADGEQALGKEEVRKRLQGLGYLE